jgi:N-acetylneuraminic acid mutarotase
MRGANADDPVPPDWTHPWSEPYNSDPYYGTLGTPSSYTTPGGRNSSSFWTDTNGNFWLFGGDGLDGSAAPVEGLLNDLWKFSPATNEWTWMGGNSTLQGCINNGFTFCGLPGSYGTQGTPSASNIPGSRESAVTWTDSGGNFWLFGGIGADSNGNQGYLNDLWMFNPTAGTWTWISGSSTVDVNLQGQPGNYGTQGVAAPGNVPPGLLGAAAWVDKSDNLWLFGGSGVADPGGVGYNFNNLWEFNTATKQWTWVSGYGSSPYPSYGVYGTLGTPAVGNLPSGRRDAISWTDSTGNVWLFGGYGIFPSGSAGIGSGDMNDLWELNMTTMQWTWIGGTAGGVPNYYGNDGAPQGSYGTLGVASPNNEPGGRESSSAWIDSSGTLWLFGGFGSDSMGSLGPLDDLWRFDPVSKEWTWMNGNAISYVGGVYGDQGVPASANVPGSRYNAAAWMDRSGNFWLFAGWGILQGANGGSTTLNDLWRFQPK